MCGGSGSSLIGAARAAGAQLYISGDISYHHFFVPDGFMLMDIGHFESEKEIVSILYSLLRKKFPNFVFQCTAALDSTNPILYL
jgi:putative NIF3 family GTP cyclohydrolase 1 type 2